MYRIVIFATLFLWANQAAQAQNQKLTPEILWKIGRVSLECVSPDGAAAIYGVDRYDLETNKKTRTLFSTKLETGDNKILTDATKNASDAEFRPDGRKIGFLMDGIFYEMNPDGTELRRISEISMNGFHYAPNGKHILYTQDVIMDKTLVDLNPDLPKASGRATDGLFYRHWKSWHDYAYSNVFYATYNNGAIADDAKNIMNEPYDSPLQPFGGMEQIAWSTDSRFIVYTCRKLNGTAEAQSTNSDLYAYDVEAGRAINLTEGMLGYDIDPVFSPDGRYLAWTSMARPGYEADRTRLMLLDLQTQQREEMTEKWDFEANSPQWSADSKQLYFLSATDFTYQLYSIAMDDHAIKPLTSGQHDYTAFKVAGNRIAATRTAMDAPAEVFTVDPISGDALPISRVTKTPWAGIAKGRVERRSITTSDKKSMNTWVVYPPDFDPAKKYPAILVCQGGPQSAFSQGFSYRWNLQLMAANGYIVIAPCRRGMPGSGSAWNDAIIGDWGGQPMRDLLSATDAMAKEEYVDANRIGAVGASFGGYSVYWLAGNHKKRFKAFVSHCGLFNLESFYGATEEVWFPENDFKGAYWNTNPSEMYKRDSPHRFVQNWDTPILVIHNELDFRVPFGEGMQAFQAAQLRGVPSRFLSFPDEGHWMSKPQNSVLWQREFFGWLDKYLK